MRLTKNDPTAQPGAPGMALPAAGKTEEDAAPDGGGFSLCQGWFLGVLLAVATFLAYQPAWNGKAIWDDAAHLTYPHLRSLHGLYRIWTEPGVTQQYYPVVSTGFWIEHKLWSDATLGYHLVNILLHVAAALLLWKILRALQVPAAGLAAAIFALHPVQVETVAWISELKNTLSAVCYFGSALAYLRFDLTRKKSAYAVALTVFAVGLMAKSVIATFPAALLVVFWWRRGKLSWKNDVLPLIPFFAAGITAGFFTSWMEQEFVGAHGSGYSFSVIERFLVAGRAFWFYLGKLVWPVDLMFSYPRWKVNQDSWWQWVFPIAAALLLGALWALRRWRRGPLAAALFFAGTLFPALGFLNVFPFKYSFVADHFQYLAACGPIVAASVGIDGIARRFGERRQICEGGICATLLAVLCILTWRQSRMYTDIETLWQTTIARNPDCWLAQNDLGSVLYAQGQVDQAIAHFRRALAIEPGYAEAENNLGAALDKNGETDEAMSHFRNALAERPEFAEAHCNLGNALLRKGQSDEAIVEFQSAVALRPDAPELHFTLGNALLQNGRADQAAFEFQKTLELQPGDAQAHYDLGVALRQTGQMDGAIAEFEKAAAIRPDFIEAQNNLGNCLLQKGRVDEAIAHLQKALGINPGYAQSHYNLGNAFLQKRQVDNAIVEFRKLLALQPGSPQARGSLAGIAWRLATSPNAALRNGAKAVELARQLDQLAGGGNPAIAATLAAAYAEAGQFEEAVAAGERALDLAKRENSAANATAIQAQLNFYKSDSPFRDAGTLP
jgi:tetratricopeptide (TPR) repeat protein